MTTVNNYSATANAVASAKDALYSKITWRILPFMFAAYVINQLDRTNISFAKLRFMSDLGLSEVAYGLGAGLFFVGYVVFEVPSNLYLEKAGARKTFIRIMILWGAMSMVTALVRTPAELYVARFLTGAAEAGFVPGVILYLTYWFPAAHRGRISSLFFMAIAFAGISGGPISGLILHSSNGLANLKDWQWLFIVEGAPAVILGVIAYLWLDDKPADAKWLSESEKTMLEQDLLANGQQRKSTKHPGWVTFVTVLRDPRVYVAALAYFAIIAGNNVLTLWIPTVITGFGVKDVVNVGLLSSIPYAVGAIGMFVVARHSDRKQERRWHTTCAMLVTGAAYAVLGGFLQDPLVAMILLIIAALGIYSAVTIFWTIPPTYLSGDSAASGIALVSSLGMFGGFFSPLVLGYAKTMTGSLQLGFYAIAALLAAGAIAIVVGIPRPEAIAKTETDANALANVH
jgi:D-galactonate transporter